MLFTNLNNVVEKKNKNKNKKQKNKTKQKKKTNKQKQKQQQKNILNKGCAIHWLINCCLFFKQLVYNLQFKQQFIKQ